MIIYNAIAFPKIAFARPARVNGLFIEIYLDEDVSVLVAELLRARGFVAVTTQQAGNLGTAIATNSSMRPVIN